MDQISNTGNQGPLGLFFADVTVTKPSKKDDVDRSPCGPPSCLAGQSRVQKMVTGIAVFEAFFI
jgi:hypothetical protein